MKDRITLLIKAKNLTAAQFADEIGVQKSSISHIISGRNNASLDFIQKIILTYPEVNMDWLMFGKGPLFRSSETTVKANIDESLSSIQPLDLLHVDLFSELTPTNGTDFRKENDFSPESESEQNPIQDVMENEKFTPLQKNREAVSSEFQIRKTENVMVSSGHNKSGTKTILKIVEFYSDNTYKEFFPE